MNRFCQCDLRYETYRNGYDERCCSNCRMPLKTADDYKRDFEAMLKQQRGEAKHMKNERSLYEMATNATEIATDTATEITRLQDLLKTPNLSKETIAEINVNLQELLRMQRVPKKTMQVFQD